MNSGENNKDKTSSGVLVIEKSTNSAYPNPRSAGLQIGPSSGPETATVPLHISFYSNLTSGLESTLEVVLDIATGDILLRHYDEENQRTRNNLLFKLYDKDPETVGFYRNPKSGKLTIVYTSESDTGTEVRATIFDADGVCIVDSIKINEQPIGERIFPFVYGRFYGWSGGGGYSGRVDDSSDFSGFKPEYSRSLPTQYCRLSAVPLHSKTGDREFAVTWRDRFSPIQARRRHFNHEGRYTGSSYSLQFWSKDKTIWKNGVTAELRDYGVSTLLYRLNSVPITNGENLNAEPVMIFDGYPDDESMAWWGHMDRLARWLRHASISFGIDSRIFVLWKENEENLRVEVFDLDPDADADQISDRWEAKYDPANGNLNPNDDLDKDGLTNLIEFRYCGNPNNRDTDDDLLPDGIEKSFTDALKIAGNREKSPIYALDNLSSFGLKPDAEKDFDNDGWSNITEINFRSRLDDSKSTPISHGSISSISKKTTQKKIVKFANKAILGVRGKKHEKGCLVTFIAPNTPAEKAGLTKGDIITKIGETEIRDFGTLTSTIGTYKPGDRVTLRILRGEDALSITVELGKREN